MAAILSIDPGGTTGLAWSTEEENNYATMVSTTKEEVWQLCEAFHVIVIERFSTSDYLSKYGLHTIEIVGGVKAICHLQHKTLVVHAPQNRYSCQDKAKEYLLAQREKFMIHEEDALAHLMYYLQTGK